MLAVHGDTPNAIRPEDSPDACYAKEECLVVVCGHEALRSAFKDIDLSSFGAPTQANEIAVSTVSGVAPDRGGSGLGAT